MSQLQLRMVTGDHAQEGDTNMKLKLSAIFRVRTMLHVGSLLWAFATGVVAALPVDRYDAATDALGLSPLLEMTLIGIAIACSYLVVHTQERP
jgi:hypothetical protein